MAKTSLRALAAAICPKVNGSSTTGVMKSRVNIPALLSSTIQTAASSPWAQLVRRNPSS